MGFSRDLPKRIAQHFTGKGSNFTRLYKPTMVLETRHANSEWDEFKVFVEYAKKYGTFRVGGYCPALCEKMGFSWPFSLSYKRRSTFYY